MKNGILTLAGLVLLLAAAPLRMAAYDGDAKKGESAFALCAGCHNTDSDEIKVGPGLKNVFKRDKLVNGKPVNPDNVKALISDGSGGMPPFGDSISPADKDNIVAFLKSLSSPMAMSGGGGAMGDPKKGATVFENCAGCHNSDSTDVKVGPGLKDLFKRDKLVNGKPVTPENVKGIVTDGSGGMPPFGDSISATDKDNLVAYLKTL
jgi:cytochrome c2